ncbi:MAG: hypothetical protein ACRCWR_08280 [Saezia sp.]
MQDTSQKNPKIDAVKRQENNGRLWNSFEIINAYYATKPALKSSQETTLLFIQCMFNLLDQLDSRLFLTSEKDCLQTARTYWLDNAKELGSTLISLCNLIESKINYRAPQEQDNRLMCLSQILSIDKDYFDEFPEFLENIHLAGLPIETIQKTISNCFKHIPELKQ